MEVGDHPRVWICEVCGEPTSGDMWLKCGNPIAPEAPMHRRIHFWDGLPQTSAAGKLLLFLPLILLLTFVAAVLTQLRCI